jgi:hypothetical protein
MIAVADEATHPEREGGGVWVPVLAIRINPRAKQPPALLQPMDLLSVPVMVTTERIPVQTLVATCSCHSPV